MKQLKFRLAKRKRNFWNLFGLLKKEYVFMTKSGESNPLDYPLIQQFTGKYDANGNEIYEGDKVNKFNRIIK